MLKNIQSVTTGNTFTTSPIKETDTGITALYCRLSQDDGNVGDSDSIINQKKILAEYAERNGYTPYQFYIDDGFSGTNFERPQFKQMIEDAKKGTVKRIICKDLSRFGRDYIKVGLYTEFIFPDKDIHFIAVNDDVDSNVQKDNDLAPFKNLFNEWYARDTSKKIKAVKKAKGLAGEHMSCVAPYGYRKNPDNPKEWLIDEESAEVVREIFRLCVDGYGPRRIANILTERKILIPSAYALEKGYAVRNNIPKNPCQWSSTVVVDVLERMDYLGHTVNFKTHRKSYKQKKKIENDKSEWKIFENTPMSRLSTSLPLILCRRFVRTANVLPKWEKCRCFRESSTVRTVERNYPFTDGQMTLTLNIILCAVITVLILITALCTISETWL